MAASPPMLLPARMAPPPPMPPPAPMALPPAMPPPAPIGRYREKGTFVRFEEIIGRENERDKIVEALLEWGNDEIISVLPIVGVDGIGKTTLAKLVYNDEMIIKGFELRIWLCVSRKHNLKKLIESIIRSASGNGSLVLGNIEILELQDVLKSILEKKKYLLILDNVWNEDPDEWNEFKRLLKVGSNGSKIVVTTRNKAVASVTGTMPELHLEGLSEENCLCLFWRKAFKEGQHMERPDLLRIAVDIVQKCKGIPLSVMALGGSLHMEQDEFVWERVRDSEAWNSQQNVGILPALRVSYEELPYYLKACLAFCSMFPKGLEIGVDKLIQLWMAQGVIQSSASCQDLEDIGMQCFRELSLRSFFQDIEEYQPLFTSVCQMHDLVHDLALSVAKTEYLVVDSHAQSIPRGVSSVTFSGYDQSELELPRSLLEHHMLRTIYFQLDGVRPTSVSFVETCISRFKHLWVLDLSDSSFEVLPSSIGELKHLRYLNLSGNENFKALPDSICGLQGLQTLRVVLCTSLNGLPKDTQNMISLRHLYLTIKQESFPDKGVARLSSLRSLFICSCKNLVCLSDELQYLSNLQTLAIVDCPRLTFLPLSMKSLTALENLSIINCEELTLFEWQDIEGLKILRSLVIGGLAKLESKDVQCLKSLRSLIISGLPKLVDMPCWLEGAANTLQYLQIARCPALMTLPKWLGEFSALEKLEIIECLKLSIFLDDLCCLSELKVLKIDNCPKLTRTYERKGEANSDSSAETYIDGLLIQ